MKKFMLLLVLTSGLLVSSPQCPAAGMLALSGNEYTVFIFCNETLGDYCAQGRIKADTFIFNGEDFGIKYFQSGVDGLVSGGEFSSGGVTFTAAYAGFKNEDKYEFNITGITIADILVFGVMDIIYTEFDPINENPIDGSAFFIGFKN